MGARYMTFQELLKDERVIGRKEAEELRLCFFIFFVGPFLSNLPNFYPNRPPNY